MRVDITTVRKLLAISNATYTENFLCSKYEMDAAHDSRVDKLVWEELKSMRGEGIKVKVTPELEKTALWDFETKPMCSIHKMILQNSCIPREFALNEASRLIRVFSISQVALVYGSAEIVAALGSAGHFERNPTITESNFFVIFPLEVVPESRERWTVISPWCLAVQMGRSHLLPLTI